MTPESKLQAAEVRRRFADLVGNQTEKIDLAKAALLVAAEEEPQLEVDHYLSVLDEMGEAGRLRVEASCGRAVEAFNGFFFDEQGFLGNENHYYDPHNSFLSDVLDRRTGIPITLSIVYMEVGRRAGIYAEGVGLPGHFIVRAREEKSVDAALVDPFYGKMIDRKDCQARLDQVFGGEMELIDEHLRATTAKDILVRLLTNLKAIYTRAKLYRQALSAIDRILIMLPDALGEHRDRGAVLAKLGRLPEAIAATQHYVQLAAHASDLEQVKEQLHLMQRKWATLN
jgi:regulator of sirC expression with transglutaminase-like and TPR domain